MECSLSIKDALDLFVSHREAIIKMWGFYSTVTLGVLGFTIGSDKATHDLKTTRIIQFGFSMFALANMIAVAVSQRELQEMAKTIEKMLLPTGLAGMTPHPFPPLGFVAFHVIIAISVVYGIQKAHVWRSSMPRKT